MIAALARFVDALRAEGIGVSPAETVDAGRALDLVGPESRFEVHAALKATLAKDRRAAEVFDRLFDRFFATPDLSLPKHRSEKGEPSGISGQRGRGDGIPPPDSERTLKPQDRPNINATGLPGQAPPASPMIPPLQMGPTGRALQQRQDPARPAKPTAAIIDRAARKDPGPRGDRRRSEFADRARLGKPPSGASRSNEPQHRTLAARMTADEERRIAHEAPRLIAALRLGLGRRLERTSRGRPWIRRALRDSVATGGVPFTIPARSPKRRKTRVVVLADVSYSTARAAGLFLWMAASFLKLGRNSRTLLFVDRPVDATEAIRRWASRTSPAAAVVSTQSASRQPRPGDAIVPHGMSFAEVIERLRDLNSHAPSDYGKAFHALLTSPMRPRGRNTVLVILGDGRTNRFEPLPWALEELASGCRAVIWLASEPRSRWGTEDSVLPLYLPWVDVLAEATDLAGLARGLTELLRRL